MDNQTTQPIEKPAEQPEQPPAKKKSNKLAIFLIAGPIVGLVLTLIGWRIASFIFGAMAANATPGLAMTASIVNIVLGFISIVCVLGIIIGVPIGIILLITKK